jgi:hypothetical protein
VPQHSVAVLLSEHDLVHHGVSKPQAGASKDVPMLQCDLQNVEDASDWSSCMQEAQKCSAIRSMSPGWTPTLC